MGLRYDQCSDAAEIATVKRDVPPTLISAAFDATLKYNSSRKLYRPLTFPPFVGEPNKEIDEAWEDLTGGEHRVIAFGVTAVGMSTKL